MKSSEIDITKKNKIIIKGNEKMSYDFEGRLWYYYLCINNNNKV